MTSAQERWYEHLLSKIFVRPWRNRERMFFIILFILAAANLVVNFLTLGPDIFSW